MKTVLVGLSGGVDSAVSAHLLKEAGYNVVGVFLKVWEPDFLPCTSSQDRLDAMRVAAHLKIPFKTYDVEEEYKKEVVDYLVSEYAQGRTPNPDVMCNRSIKFGVFWDKAQKDGADYIATGHYAQNIEDRDGFHMMRGVDEGKDQSYFLWTLTQDDLRHTLLPVGGLQKKEVRTIAESIGLPNATKKDSQGICFLGHVDMSEFLKRYVPTQRGIIRTMDGTKVGEHDGVVFYTLGQHVSVSSDKRLYVVAKSLEKNELIVDISTAVSEKKKEFVLEKVSWVGEKPNEATTYHAQIRYHGTSYGVHVIELANAIRLVFDEPVLIAGGQSVVLYKGERCIGGGVVR